MGNCCRQGRKKIDLIFTRASQIPCRGDSSKHELRHAFDPSFVNVGSCDGTNRQIDAADVRADRNDDRSGRFECSRLSAFCAPSAVCSPVASHYLQIRVADWMRNVW
jgi:hypothetical protein